MIEDAAHRAALAPRSLAAADMVRARERRGGARGDDVRLRRRPDRANRQLLVQPGPVAELGRALGVPVQSNGRRWWHATGDRHECPVDEVVAAAAAEQKARDGG
jgi:hypothetical protein